MAKSHYSFQKRKKELARKLKQEKKRQRRLEKGKVDPELTPADPEEQTDDLQPSNDEDKG